MLTTLGYKLGTQKPVYALEGSIAIAGALVQWLRDNLGLIEKIRGYRDAWPQSVDDNGGIYFVPAFSGLYAPYWKDNARGVIVGMTRYVNKRPYRPRRPGSHRLSDPRGAGRDEQRQRVNLRH